MMWLAVGLVILMNIITLGLVIRIRELMEKLLILQENLINDTEEV